ncbi:MAG TPA: hypothetical protein VKY85_24565, partial [Candidatus Angelobacter sp.]|nr:hypothetical protein [Candidatus Angelobacter sp.]
KRQPRASHIPTATATAPLLLGKQIKRKVELIAPYTVSHPQIFQTKQEFLMDYKCRTKWCTAELVSPYRTWVS